MSIILVTGAGGFLGQSVVAALLRKGHVIRALIRSATPVERFGWPPEVDVVRADLREGDGLDTVVSGSDAVIHLAALTEGSIEEQRATNVGGTAHLLDAMATTGVRRLVLASSVAVYDWHQARHVLDEETLLERRFAGRDAYCRSKLEQEELVRQVSAMDDFALTVLRPGFIWGAGQLAIGAVGRSVGPFILQIGSDRILPLTYVENCAELFAHVVDNPSATGMTFNVVDIDPVTAKSHAASLMLLLPRLRINLTISYRLFYGAIRFLFPLAQSLLATRYRLPGLFIPEQFEAQFKPLQFKSRLARLPGWKPPYTYAQALKKTCDLAEAIDLPPRTPRHDVK